MMLPHSQDNGKSGQEVQISDRWAFAQFYPVDSPAQRLILLTVAQACNGKTLVAYISKKTVAKRTGLCRTSIYTHVKRLEEKGALVACDMGKTTQWLLPEPKEIMSHLAKYRRERDAERAVQKAEVERPLIPERLKDDVQEMNNDVQEMNNDVQEMNNDVQEVDTIRGSSGKQTGVNIGDRNTCDSTSVPDLPESSYFSQFREDPKTKTKAGQVLEPEVLSVGDTLSAAQGGRYDVTSPTAGAESKAKPHRVGNFVQPSYPHFQAPKTAQEKREARIEAQTDAEVRQWQEEQAKAGQHRADEGDPAANLAILREVRESNGKGTA